MTLPIGTTCLEETGPNRAKLFYEKNDKRYDLSKEFPLKNKSNNEPIIFPYSLRLKAFFRTTSLQSINQ